MRLIVQELYLCFIYHQKCEKYAYQETVISFLLIFFIIVIICGAVAVEIKGRALLKLIWLLVTFWTKSKNLNPLGSTKGFSLVTAVQGRVTRCFEVTLYGTEGFRTNG